MKNLNEAIRQLELQKLKLVMQRTDSAIAEAKAAIKAMRKKQLQRRRELARQEAI